MYRLPDPTAAARRALRASLLAGAAAAIAGLAGCREAPGANADAGLGMDSARRGAGTGDITVAVVWPWQARGELLYGQGLDLAVEEINAAGGIGGRKIRLLREDDGESVNQGRLIAKRIASNPDVVAVIGHLQSYVTVPAAAIYDVAGLVLISPVGTDVALTSNGYTRVFRAIFTDREAGAQMADYAHERGYRRVAIYYVRTEYGRALANAFEERAASHAIAIVARESYDPGQSVADGALERVFGQWAGLELDAIFLAGEVPLAGQIIAAIRAAGIDVPILGGDAMSSPALIQEAGPAAEGTVVAASFHPDMPSPEVRSFVERFRQRYGTDPDPASALGYDAVRVLAAAMRQARSLTPDDIAAALHSMRDFPGVTGPFTFDDAGNLVGRRIVTLVVRDGRFHYLSPVSAQAEEAP